MRLGSTVRWSSWLLVGVCALAGPVALRAQSGAPRSIESANPTAASLPATVPLAPAGISWPVAPAEPSVAPSAPDTRLALEDIGFFPAESFAIRDGLPAVSIATVAVTLGGQVWVGTMRGLARWNSRRFVPEPGPKGVFEHEIADLAATPDGKLWASAPGHGVFVREEGAWRDVGKPFGLPDEGGIRLRSFSAAARGEDAGEFTPLDARVGIGRPHYRLFATGRGTLHEWTGAAWRARALPAALANLEIFDVLLDAGATLEQDVLWVATFGQGLWRCVGEAACQRVQIDAPGPRFNEVSSLARWTDPADGSSVLWVASYGGGLARLQNGKWQRFLQSNGGLPSNFLQRLLVQATPGQPPHLWVGTRTGLAHRVGERWIPLDPSARYDGATVKTLAAAHSASGAAQLWIGSDQGLGRLPLGGPWRTLSQTGRRGNGVWSLLYERREGEEQLWLGSDGDGLMHYAHGGWRQYGTRDGLPSETIRSVFRDPDSDAFLVGSWGGELSRLQGDRFVTVSTPWAKSDHEAIGKIVADRGGVRWFALREGGLARLKAGTWTLYGPRDGYPGRIFDLQRAGDVLWGSTSARGLVRIDDAGWQYFSRAQGLPDSAYFGLSLVPDAAGRLILWAGSQRAGVVRVDVTDPSHPVAVRMPALPTPPNPLVYDIAPDGRGNIFLSTNYGAALWRPDGRGGWHAQDFHRGDGLPHDEGNLGALQVDAQHRIWLGTLGGVGMYSDAATPPATSAAPLVFERVLANGVELGPATLGIPLTLRGAKRDLQFEVALRTGERESGIRYRSQMRGLEPAPTAWSEDNTRSFVALPPGQYRLEVEARDADGLAARPLEFAVSVPLPFWRTWPAVLALALLVVAAFVALLRLRERALREREKQLVDLVRQRTSELETRGVELRRINEELTRLSYHDPLTDLANRRMLLERLHGEWELAQARGTSLAFLLFDLDAFKAYNDHRGHLAGDDALREVGRRIDAQVTRDGATAGRYGGEEFGVVLPGLDVAAAALEGERIRRAIELAALPHPTTPQGVVTISVGVAAIIPRAGFSAELLIAAADAALYRAKGAGRNRVETATP